MQDGGENKIVNYGGERDLISSGPQKCLVSTLLCTKGKMHTLIYKDVNTDRSILSLVTVVANSFNMREIIDVHDNDIIKDI